jgi:hypothetical protein
MPQKKRPFHLYFFFPAFPIDNQPVRYAGYSISRIGIEQSHHCLAAFSSSLSPVLPTVEDETVVEWG